ncbi:MAG: hypothetical protein ACQER9_04540 [Nanobdellota archaeon]
MSEEIKNDQVEALKEAGFKNPEIGEIRKDYYDYTGFPDPEKKYWLSYEAAEYTIEEMYFWMLEHGNDIQDMPYVHKITDIFASSQGSSMFGDMGTRSSALQNQASNLLATFGNMSKDLFKRVRELRQIRERLSYYKKADKELSFNKRKEKVAIAAENTLKDAWINLVEGGGENPSSIYGLGRKVGYTILPDLFLQAPPLKEDEIKKYVDSLDFNKTVKIALERKLYQFYHWKEQTYKELKFKNQFQKKLIYQHYQNMKLYLNWIKPYIKNSDKLQSNETFLNSSSIITAFESSMVEIEVLLYKPLKKIEKKDNKGNVIDKKIMNAVVNMHFIYRSNPNMDFHAKDSWQQKGPSHLGKVDAIIRAYGWTDEDIEKYRKLKTKEEIGMIKSIDYTLKDEADLLGDDLKQIIDEVEEDMGNKLNKKNDKENVESDQEAIKKQKEEVKRVTKEMYTPFTDVFKGFKDVFIEPFSKQDMKKNQEEFNNELSDAKNKAVKTAEFVAWQIYKNYKKAHRMVTW